MTLDELIAALEKADGPSLDLDHAIATVAHVDDEFGVPLFTSSIDAALALIPDDWVWTLWSNVGHDGTSEYGAELYCREIGCVRSETADEREPAANAAIALCIAALKARREA